MQIDKPDTKSKGGLFGIVALVFLAIAGAVVYFGVVGKAPHGTSELQPFEIANFIGKPEYFSEKDKKWVPLKRGQTFSLGDKVRTDDGSEIDLHVPGQIKIRLKGNSELERKGPGLFKKELKYRLHLEAGELLGSTEKEAEKKDMISISTPTIVAAVRGTVFSVRVDPKTKKSWVGVLRGALEVTPKEGDAESVMVKDLQKTEIKPDGSLVKPVRVSRQEWDNMKEAYELIQKSAKEEADQLDLSKEAGGLFEYVLDHGTFFTPKVGYSWRKFKKDMDSGKVHLEVEYDVFPRGSYVGMYIKVRGVDASKFQALQFRVQRLPDAGYPAAFRIELKSKNKVIRAFSPRVFKRDWQTMQFPFQITKPTPLTEITFVFSHEKAGEFTRGALRFKDIELLPLPPEPAAPAPAPTGTTSSDNF